MYELAYADDWDKYFKKMNKDIQRKIWKQIQQIKHLEKAKHLKHGLPFFIVETTQYRLDYKKEENKRIIYFVGSHKQYEKWYLNLMK